MSDSIDENIQLKHIEKRNKILFSLEHAYITNSYRSTSEIDQFPNNLAIRNEKLQLPIVENLLIEMNGNEFDNNTDCYRCKHFLNVPQNLSGFYERVSDCTKLYEADINFVQAIVWLKSATSFMQDISVEQFHVVFHKQWTNTRYTNFNRHKQDSVFIIQDKHYERSVSSNALNANKASDTNVDNDSEYTSSIDLLLNPQCNGKQSTSKFLCQKDINEENNVFIEKTNNIDAFISSQSLERFLNIKTCTQMNEILNNKIIPDSDEDYSSSSDIFRDSSGSQEVCKIARDKRDCKLLECDENATEKSVGEYSLNSHNIIWKNNFLGTKNDLEITSCIDELSDVTLFDEDCLLSRKSCTQLGRQLTLEPDKQIVTSLTQVSDLDFHDKNPISSSRRIVNAGSPKKDSAYDTYQLSVEYTSPSKNEGTSVPLSLKNDNITPYQRDKEANSTRDLELLSTDVIEKDRISIQDGQHSSFSTLNSCKRTDLTKMNCNHDGISWIQNKCSQGDKDSIEDAEYGRSSSKKRKLNPVYESTMVTQSENEKEKISPEWMRFMLDTLNVDDVAFQSVKMILLVLRSERITKEYMRKRCWKETLEAEAVNAVLNFCDVFEAENKTNVCTYEILQAVTKMLDIMIESSQLNKVTIFTHQITIVLQLCTSMQVCIGTINHLTTKLNSYGDILNSLINSRKANLYNVTNQLHIIFYALSFCLQKYRLVFLNKRNNNCEEEIIPPVLDLWKKRLIFEGAIAQDSAEKRERQWLIILDNFTVTAAEHFVQLAEKSRKLVNLLTCD